MRLPTWVNVVLVLTLLASCSAANTAGDAVNRLVGGSSSAESLSPDEVRDLCRLLGAVAAKEGIDLDETLTGDATSSCATVAREAVQP